MTLTAYQFFCFLGFMAIGLLLMVLGLIMVGRGEPKSVFGGDGVEGHPHDERTCTSSHSGKLASQGKCALQASAGIKPGSPPILPPRDACMEDIKRRMSISN